MAILLLIPTQSATLAVCCGCLLHLTETCELKAGSVVVTTPDGSDNASRLAWQLLLPRPQVATGQDGRPKLYHYGKRCRSLM